MEKKIDLPDVRIPDDLVRLTNDMDEMDRSTQALKVGNPFFD